MGPEVQACIGACEARTDKKATQAELAARLKTTTSVVSRIESGNQNLSVDTVEKVAEALGKTVEFLFK
ncbi:MAG: helix-turn-helix domain-containing protein [Youngiibacter sp.]|nr:helix-turn-helix domain-containing protein [Youngiibacter sp.]